MEKFRKTTEDDLTELMALIEEGIAFLKAQGSPQWQNGYGPKDTQIKEDIAKGESYVLVKDGKIAASAALVSGDDPVYNAITGAGWDGNGLYLSIHRVVVSSHFKGQKLSAKLLQALEVVALERGIVDLRIDTYKANIGMQKNIQAAGYQYKGEVTFPFPNGERLAFQKRLITN